MIAIVWAQRTVVLQLLRLLSSKAIGAGIIPHLPVAIQGA